MMNRPHPNLDDEHGLTLIELIIASAMAVVITGAAVAMLVSALQRQPELTERADQIGDARTAVERIVRDVRQGVLGTAVTTPSTGVASRLQLETHVDGRCGTTVLAEESKNCQVVYQCSSEVCTRTTGTGAGTFTERLIGGVRNATSVFEAVSGESNCGTTATTATTFVEVSIELRSKKAGVTKVQDGAGLRSCS